MSETTQPGVRLDAQTWERFRQFVKNQHGGVRGNLRTELEAALNNHMDAARGPGKIDRIENDVATIKAMIAEGEADGGEVAPTPSEPSSARPRRSEKPPANQSRAKKVEYLTELLFDEHSFSRDGGGVNESVLRNIIRDEYAFEDDTLDEYVELILSNLDAEQSPVYDEYIWGERIDQDREKLKEEAGAELDGASGSDS